MTYLGLSLSRGNLTRRKQSRRLHLMRPRSKANYRPLYNLSLRRRQHDFVIEAFPLTKD